MEKLRMTIQFPPLWITSVKRAHSTLAVPYVSSDISVNSVVRSSVHLVWPCHVVPLEVSAASSARSGSLRILPIGVRSNPFTAMIRSGTL
jgi:hypothetical protein